MWPRGKATKLANALVEQVDGASLQTTLSLYQYPLSVKLTIAAIDVLVRVHCSGREVLVVIEDFVFAIDSACCVGRPHDPTFEPVKRDIEGASSAQLYMPFVVGDEEKAAVMEMFSSEQALEDIRDMSLKSNEYVCVFSSQIHCRWQWTDVKSFLDRLTPLARLQSHLSKAGRA